MILQMYPYSLVELVCNGIKLGVHPPKIIGVLKTVACIAGKKNPAIQNFFIRFSIENFIANISLYALSWPKLNFGCYLTFEILS